MKNRTRVMIGFAVLMITLGVSDALRGVFANIFASHFRLSAEGLSLIVTISYIGNLIFLLFGGRVIDKFERKRAMMFFVALWTCAIGIFILTDSYILLIVGMFIAMGCSTLLNTTVNLITPLLFAASPGFAVGFLFFIQGIGTSGSQSVIGNLAKDFSAWKIVNFFMLAAGIVVLVILFFCQLPDNKGEPDKAKSKKGSVVKHPAFIPLVLAFGFYFVAEHGIMNWLVNYATNGLGAEQGQAANFTALFFGGVMAGRLLLSPFVDKLGVFKSLAIFASAAGVLYVSGILMQENGLWLVSASGIFFSILYPTLIMTVPKLWPQSVVSGASGAIISVASLADIVFNACFGSLILSVGYKTSFLVMPIALICLIATLWFIVAKFNRASKAA